MAAWRGACINTPFRVLYLYNIKIVSRVILQFPNLAWQSERQDSPDTQPEKNNLKKYIQINILDWSVNLYSKFSHRKKILK